MESNREVLVRPATTAVNTKKTSIFLLSDGKSISVASFIAHSIT